MINYYSLQFDQDIKEILLGILGIQSNFVDFVLWLVYFTIFNSDH